MGLKHCAHVVLWRVSDSGRETILVILLGRSLCYLRVIYQQKTNTTLSFNYKDEHTLINWYYSYESQIDTMIIWEKNTKKAYICAESEVDAKIFLQGEWIREILKYILSLLLHNILNNIYNRSCNTIYQEENSS